MIDYVGIDEEKNGPKDLGEKVYIKGKFFDERWSKHRSITDVGFSPHHPEIMICSYNANEVGTHDPDGIVMLWSMHVPTRPEFIFQCQSAVMTAFVSKFSPHTVIGGTYSGQLVVWDTRSKQTPVQRTPLSSLGHTHPIYGLELVGTQNAHNLVSISTDGKMCVWSLDMLVQPQETLELQNKQHKQVSVTAMAFPESEVNRFFVGSEEGAVYEAFRHGNRSGITERFEGHFGPVTGIDFHTSRGSIDFSDLILTSSFDWTCKLWSSKNAAKPLYSFEDAGDYIYDVRWSPQHPSLFATVDGTGSLDLWNLNTDTEQPITQTAVTAQSSGTSKALNRLCWSQDGKKIVTGDSGGTLHLYDISEQTAVPQVDEWKLFQEKLAEIAQSGSEN